MEATTDSLQIIISSFYVLILLTAEGANIPSQISEPPTTTVQTTVFRNKPCAEPPKQNIISWSKQELGGTFIYDSSRPVNCSDSAILVQESEQGPIEEWKTNAIIVCTVTAAIEVAIVIFIVLYWKQIRWTMRKITCPCDESGRQRRADDSESGSSEDSPLSHAGTRSTQHGDVTTAFVPRTQEASNTPDIDPEPGPSHIIEPEPGILCMMEPGPSSQQRSPSRLIHSPRHIIPSDTSDEDISPV